MRQAFRQEEAEQILTEAARRSAEEARLAMINPEISDERLRGMAEELGISEEVLAKVLLEREQQKARAETVAVEETTATATLQMERAAFIAHRRSEFYQDLWSYLGVNGMLIGIWALDGAHGDFWPKWVMFFWAIGLFFHAVSAFTTRGDEFEKEWTRWSRRRRRRAEKAEARERKRSQDPDDE